MVRIPALIVGAAVLAVIGPPAVARGDVEVTGGGAVAAGIGDRDAAPGATVGARLATQRGVGHLFIGIDGAWFWSLPPDGRGVDADATAVRGRWTIGAGVGTREALGLALSLRLAAGLELVHVRFADTDGGPGTSTGPMGALIIGVGVRQPTRYLGLELATSWSAIENRDRLEQFSYSVGAVELRAVYRAATRVAAAAPVGAGAGAGGPALDGHELLVGAGLAINVGDQASGGLAVGGRAVRGYPRGLDLFAGLDGQLVPSLTLHGGDQYRESGSAQRARLIGGAGIGSRGPGAAGYVRLGAGAELLHVGTTVVDSYGGGDHRERAVDDRGRAGGARVRRGR